MSNTYVNADTSHKVFFPVAGPEFGERYGKMIVINRDLYGFLASGAEWYSNLSSTLR